MSTQEQLIDLHTEQSLWQEKIRNYKEELKGWDAQLLKLVGAIKGTEGTSQLERFQNQIIVQNEVLDIMRHDFKQYENEIEFLQNHQVDKTAEGIAAMHDKEEDKLLTFEHNFDSLRREFNNFVSQIK